MRYILSGGVSPYWPLKGVPPGNVSRICPPSNLNNPSNIQKETGKVYRTLIVPKKVNQVPGYRSSKNIFE